MKLSIDFDDWEGKQQYLEYSDFAISCKGDKFRLLYRGNESTYELG